MIIGLTYNYRNKRYWYSYSNQGTKGFYVLFEKIIISSCSDLLLEYIERVEKDQCSSMYTHGRNEYIL
jgi:hypothetical protein